MKLRMHTAAALLAALLAAPLATGADLTASMSEGKPDLKSIGPIAFGPEGILFAADSKSAAVFAIATGDTKGVQADSLKVENLDEKIAALLGTSVEQILVSDLAVNPASGTPYLAVSRGRGPDANPVLLKVNGDGSLALVSLDKVKFSIAALPNAPADKVVGQGRRRKNARLESITDIAYTNGDVIVAGLSNEEFASSLRRIPFPFKEVGKGTGLGLSTVYGIIKQSGGFIFADSVEGEGTTFAIYLPVHYARAGERTPTPPVLQKPKPSDLWGSGTILLVEDEDMVRSVAQRALARQGYTVLAAENGEAALELIRELPDLDLLVSDVVMPLMDGPTMARHIREAYPDLPILFMSGYAEEQLRNSIDLDNVAFLPKPFSVQQLAEAAREVLVAK